MMRRINELLKAPKRFSIAIYLLVLLLYFILLISLDRLFSLPLLSENPTAATAFLFPLILLMSFMPSVIKQRILKWNAIGTGIVVMIVILGFLASDVRLIYVALVSAFVMMISTAFLKQNPDVAYIRRTVAEKQWNETIVVATRMIYEGNNACAAHIMRGIAYLQIGEHTKSLKDYEQAIALGAPRVQMYSATASVLDTMGQHERALEYVKKAVELEFSYTNVIRGISLLIKVKKFDKAIAECNKLLTRNPKSMLAFQWRGYANLGKKDYAAAERDFTMALRMGGQKQAPQLFQSRAQVRLILGKYEDALKDASLAIAHKAQLLPALLNRAYGYLALGEYTNALADLRASEGLPDAEIPSAVSFATVTEYRQMLHAWVAFKSGDADAAVERWRALVAQDARFGDADWLKQELDFSALEDETTRAILKHITPDISA